MNILFAVEFWEDYDGGGIVAVFSTEEKAAAYAENYKLAPNESVQLVKMQVDVPDSQAEIPNTYRHG